MYDRITSLIVIYIIPIVVNFFITIYQIGTLKDIQTSIIIILVPIILNQLTVSSYKYIVGSNDRSKKQAREIELNFFGLIISTFILMFCFLFLGMDGEPIGFLWVNNAILFVYIVYFFRFINKISKNIEKDDREEINTENLSEPSEGIKNNVENNIKIAENEAKPVSDRSITTAIISILTFVIVLVLSLFSKNRK